MKSDNHDDIHDYQPFNNPEGRNNATTLPNSCEYYSIQYL